MLLWLQCARQSRLQKKCFQARLHHFSVGLKQVDGIKAWLAAKTELNKALQLCTYLHVVASTKRLAYLRHSEVTGQQFKANYIMTPDWQNVHWTWTLQGKYRPAARCCWRCQCGAIRHGEVWPHQLQLFERARSCSVDLMAERASLSTKSSRLRICNITPDLRAFVWATAACAMNHAPSTICLQAKGTVLTHVITSVKHNLQYDVAAAQHFKSHKQHSESLIPAANWSFFKTNCTCAASSSQTGTDNWQTLHLQLQTPQTHHSRVPSAGIVCSKIVSENNIRTSSSTPIWGLSFTWIRIFCCPEWYSLHSQQSSVEYQRSWLPVHTKRRLQL